MKYAWILTVSLLLAPFACAQTQIPAGTLVPIVLHGALNANHAHPGQQIRAEVMQNIPGTPIRRRSTILGHVVSATPSTAGNAQLVLTFDAVLIHGQRIPLKTNLRALASFMEVADARMPQDMSDQGNTPEVATTEQIGGELDYRAGGRVDWGNQAVGRPTAYGVLGLPRTQVGKPCRGTLDGNKQPQAFWLFSTNACGVYGLRNIRIVHAGRTNPLGTITLASGKGRLDLSGGSAMLLRVQGS